MDCVCKACQLHIPASVLLACVYDVCCVVWGGTRQGWSLARLAIGGHCQALPRSMWPWASFARATCHSVFQCYQALLAAQWSGEQLARSQTLTHQPWPSHPTLTNLRLHWVTSWCLLSPASSASEASVIGQMASSLETITCYPHTMDPGPRPEKTWQWMVHC